MDLILFIAPDDPFAHPVSSVLIARGQSELSAKINELTMKFGASTTDMEKSVRETMMQEMAAEKIRDIAAMQKKVLIYLNFAVTVLFSPEVTILDC